MKKLPRQYAQTAFIVINGVLMSSDSEKTGGQHNRARVMKILQQTAIVTGASRGIGAAIAERLAVDGFNVIVNYTGRKSDADKVVEKIVAAKGCAVSFQADVQSAKAVKAMFDFAVERFGGVDVLVNNAGIMPSTMPRIADTDDATFDDVFSVNVKGTFNTLREAAKQLNNGGRIINFSSSLVGLLREGTSVYTASKAAVEIFTAIFARELRGKDITVNAVAPGPTATELFLTGKSEEMLAAITKSAPLERLGEPRDIASAVSFLAGADGAWVNGQVVRVNGGII